MRARRPPRGGYAGLASFVTSLAIATASGARAAPTPPPNALWHVVHDLCVPDRRLLGLPLPCSRVDLKAGYAVVPDPGSADQVLLVPTRRIVGIEDPYLLQDDAPNYWQDAWQARDLLVRRVGGPIPRESLAMAVNAAPGRSQKQLHIHISCIRPDIADLLQASAPALTERWSRLMLQGHAWQARSVAGTDLTANNPFKTLAQAYAGEVDLSAVTLVVAAARLSDGRPGFVLLSRTADPTTGYAGHGEFLLDETCRAARESPPAAN